MVDSHVQCFDFETWISQERFSPEVYLCVVLLWQVEGGEVQNDRRNHPMLVSLTSRCFPWWRRENTCKWWSVRGPLTVDNNILRHFTTFYNISQHFTAFYNILQNFTTFYNILQHFTKFSNATSTISTVTPTISDAMPRFCNPAVDLDILWHFLTFFDNLQNFTAFYNIFWQNFSTFYNILRHLTTKFTVGRGPFKVHINITFG